MGSTGLELGWTRGLFEEVAIWPPPQSACTHVLPPLKVPALKFSPPPPRLSK